jgi:hypothetical protein
MDKIELLDKLTALIENEEAALAISNEIEKIAAQPDGTATDKTKSIADWAEVTYPDLVKNKKTKLKEIVLYAMPATPVAPTPTPPTADVSTVAISQADVVNVRVCAKMAKNNGHFYDSISEQWIGPEPVKVPKTIFILQKLGSGEIVEV